jgi:hypothetical protein
MTQLYTYMCTIIVTRLALSHSNTKYHANYFLSSDKDDDAGLNKTVKPTAFMTLLRDGIDVSGGNVKLTDVITMMIQLDTEFLRTSRATIMDTLSNIYFKNNMLIST